ncbi:pilus assembly protein PilM [Candidatus Dojkabacteria bacterium]|uniref:Pilus assembly protein PilM n=1 Tax=Candidatus Dojkabacteria bacterium TaxID=2099670 RepID=A0A955KUY0_9BACT|nr:pilus assembly protein PilM [Candidatus Dojkabacteria bacterium]MCB9790858.1 pilus assembly protein PilM [Candidatus Nomurabacteria bacterium]
MFKLPFSKSTSSDVQPPPNSNMLSIDIGTEILKVVLFNANPHGINIHKVARIQQQQSAMSKGQIQNLNTVLENCDLAISEITSGLEPNEMPTHVVMGIAGEYIQGVSIIVNYEREAKFDNEVTKEEEEKIISKVHEQIINEGKNDLAARTGLVHEDIEILHITVTGMEIGGMNVNTLVGFRGKSVKLYFYASFAPKTYVESLKKIADALKLQMIGVVAQPFAVARAYGDARRSDFSAIFVDIGGGTTDIAVVDHGNVLDTQMFAFGGRAFTKEIAKGMNLDYRHAESRKRKYSNNDLESKVHSEVKQIVYPTTELWMKTFAAALGEIEDVDVFPPQIYLCGGGAMLPDIKNVMLEYPWTKLLPFAKIPKVNIFLPDRLSGVTDHTGDLAHPYDVTPVAIARFAYDKFTNPENYYKGS